MLWNNLAVSISKNILILFQINKASTKRVNYRLLAVPSMKYFENLQILMMLKLFEFLGSLNISFQVASNPY